MSAPLPAALGQLRSPVHMPLTLVDWRRAVVRVGRELAAERSSTYTGLFSDTLEGDLARLEVLRRLRHQYPDVPAKRLFDVIEEALT